ncbi:hypothetical protein FACS1894105_11420 [Clostridia bacterium]|nr:hypothetical protein FACS1894105_11420 [Clostridia bacterium]
MRKEYTIVEIFNPNTKSIEDKLKEAFIIFLTEKLINSKIQTKNIE